MTDRPKTFGCWLRRHSLTLVAAVGGATGVAYAAAWHGDTPTSTSSTQTTVSIVKHEATTLKESRKEVTPPRDTVRDTVQIALLLDTSSSMDGLINQARSHLWTMVDQMGKLTRVVDGPSGTKLTRGVKVELALYEYGNDTISAQRGHIRQVQAFTGDLDKVSEKLTALFTKGGFEYVGQAIEVAANGLRWSTDPDTMKFVFVAGNEEFDQGPVSVAWAMKVAAGKGINVQLIFCGHGKDLTWASAATLAKSDLTSIDQNFVAQHIPSPQDDQILALGNELNSTYMAYGTEGQSSLARQTTADRSSAKMSPKVALERMQLKSKKTYDNRMWDVVDAIENDGKFLETTPDEQLPTELRGKTLAEKQQIVDANTSKRNAIQGKIAKLEVERTAFLETARAKAKGAAVNSLETELMKTTKKVASQKGYK